MPTGTRPRAAGDALGVCLTGQARWFPLTFANLRQLVLRFLAHRWRGYYVGPADGHFAAASSLVKV